MVFNMTKAKTPRFGLKTLHYDGANLRNKFYHPWGHSIITFVLRRGGVPQNANKSERGGGGVIA